MHAGFLLIVLAHLFSAWGGSKQVLPVMEGGVIGFPDGTSLQLTNLRLGPKGLPARLQRRSPLPGRQPGGASTIGPNHPSFYRGSASTSRRSALYPYRAALIEIHREPGAGLALAGRSSPPSATSCCWSCAGDGKIRDASSSACAASWRGFILSSIRLISLAIV